MLAFSPLRSFASVGFDVRGLAPARRRVGQVWGSGGLPFAALRVPCDARFPGPAAQLPPLAALAVVEQGLRVRSRSAPNARAARKPALLGGANSPHPCPTRRLAGPGVCIPAPRTPSFRRPEGGAALGRLCAAEERSLEVGARIWRASSSDSLPVFDHSERSERRELGSATSRRVPQGTRSEAKGKHRSPSAAPPSGQHRSLRQRTLNISNGPGAEACFARRGSRVARWSN